jgi:hypothetical protein
LADISPDPWLLSTTENSNSPSGATNISTGLDDNLRALGAALKTAITTLTSVAGTNTITASSANVTAYATGQSFKFFPAATNTGATTLNINSLGAKNVFYNGAACIGGEIRTSAPCEVIYDGTQFQILSGITTANGSTASTFTFDGTGGTTASLTMEWQKNGNFVTLFIPTAQATSGTGSVSLTANTALPAGIRPPTNPQYQLSVPITNNGGAVSPPGLVSISTAGIVVINRDGTGTAFTNSSTCGTAGNSTVVYYIG